MMMLLAGSPRRILSRAIRAAWRSSSRPASSGRASARCEGIGDRIDERLYGHLIVK